MTSALDTLTSPSNISKEVTEPLYNSNCKPSWPYINIDLMSMLNADFSIAAVLISFGAVLGHTNPLQLLIMTIIEIVLFNINEVIGRDYVMARDAGDTIFVHMFGAYFGIFCSWMLYRWEASDHSKAGSDNSSDLTSMLGTIFMWMFWPSFNAGALTGTMQMRGFVNTYLSLCACCVATFTTSAIVNQKKKFSMEHVQNATLAGGIAVGACCDMIITPFGSVLIGGIAGVLSTLSFKYLAPFLAEKCNLLDTCGVHNIHGVSSVFGGLLSVLFAGMATTEEYDQYNVHALTDSTKSSLLLVFPRPEDPMEEVHVWGDGGWTPHKQAIRQLAAMGHTALIAAVGGVVTGLIMRCVAKSLPNPEKNDKEMLYEDEAYFDVEEESGSDSLKNSKVVGASVVTLEY